MHGRQPLDLSQLISSVERDILLLEQLEAEGCLMRSLGSLHRDHLPLPLRLPSNVLDRTEDTGSLCSPNLERKTQRQISVPKKRSKSQGRAEDGVIRQNSCPILQTEQRDTQALYLHPRLSVGLMTMMSWAVVV